MSKLSLYRVVREHTGDRPYAAGETRTAAPHEVVHLVPHVLDLIGDAPDEKAEGPLDNKAEGASPAVKTPRRRK